MSKPLDIEEPYPGWAQENNGPLLLGVMGAMTGLTIVFVVGRIYSRMISLGRLGFDDYILIISVLLSLLYVALTAVAVSYGLGRHTDTLAPEDTRRIVYYTAISFMPGIASFALPKFAVVILLAKVLDPGRTHRVIMWIISILYLLLTIGMLVINIAQCQPVQAQWGAVEGTCWNWHVILSYALSLGISSVLVDFYLAAYPTIVLFRLQTNWKKKLALSSSLGFGYCAGAIASYKCYTLAIFPAREDYTWTADDLVLWTNIEADCVLIGACIPCLFPLVKKVFGASALSGGTPMYGNQKQWDPNGTIITIGSSPKKQRRPVRTWGFSQLDTLSDGNKDIVLEERALHTSTTELRIDETTQTVSQEGQQEREGSQLQAQRPFRQRWQEVRIHRP